MKKMYKRSWLMLLLAFVLALAVACGGDASPHAEEPAARRRTGVPDWPKKYQTVATAASWPPDQLFQLGRLYGRRHSGPV
jgi:hypothetical protein